MAATGSRSLRGWPKAIPAAVVAVYLVLGVTWAVTNAPFTAPDEAQHYLRALGIRTDGALAGPRTEYTGPILAPKATEWRRKLTRAATVPPGMSPTGLDCALFRPHVTPVCADGVLPNRTTIVQDTYDGSFAPLPYFLPALATSFGNDPVEAGRYGRLAMLLMWIALLSVAVWMLWDRSTGGLSLLGLVVAITPAAVFIGSSLNNSGIEIAASVAFFSALLRLARAGQERFGAAWGVAAVGASALMLSRTLGLAWLVCGLVIYAALLGPSRIRPLLLRPPVPAILSASALSVSAAVAVLWELAYGPRVSVTLLPSISTLYDGAWQLRGGLPGLIGLFGHQDVRLGAFGTAAWGFMAALLAGTAVWFGARRERVALLVAFVLGVAVPIYLYASVTRHQGVVTMGRHLLPLMVTIPLLSGEIVRRHHSQLKPALSVLLVPVLVSSAAAVQLLAWWVNSHRYAVGADGPWWFLSGPEWSPLGGWLVWTVLMIGIALCVIGAAAASAVLARRHRSNADALMPVHS